MSWSSEPEPPWKTRSHAAAVRVEENLAGVEPHPGTGGPKGPVAVHLARAHARDEDVPVVVRAAGGGVEAEHPRGPGVVDVIEEQQIDPGCVPREHAEVGAVRGGRRPEGGTRSRCGAVGRVRPRRLPTQLGHGRGQGSPLGSTTSISAANRRAGAWEPGNPLNKPRQGASVLREGERPRRDAWGRWLTLPEILADTAPPGRHEGVSTVADDGVKLSPESEPRRRLDERLQPRTAPDDRWRGSSQPPPGSLYEHAIRYEKDASIAEDGALVAYSGVKTGRSPKDKRVVKHPDSEKGVWWGPVNIPCEAQTFAINRQRALDYLNTRERLYCFDGFAGWDPKYRRRACRCARRTSIRH